MIAFRDLLKTRMGGRLLTANEGDTGPILLQPVGGMDMTIKALVRRLEGRIRYRAMVASVKVGDDGVTISFDQNRERRTLQADYCLNCVPTHLMVGIDHNFPNDYVRAMKYVRRGDAYKAAFQAKERFWEKEDIYGGITWMSSPSSEMWYPSHGIHKPRGVILAAYNYGGGMFHTVMTQAQRIEAHLQDGFGAQMRTMASTLGDETGIFNVVSYINTLGRG